MTEAFCILNIPVTVEDDDGFVVSDDIVNMYGAGDTLAEAKQDYKDNVLIYHEWLQVGRLGPGLEKHLEYLNGKLNSD